MLYSFSFILYRDKNELNCQEYKTVWHGNGVQYSSAITEKAYFIHQETFIFSWRFQVSFAQNAKAFSSSFKNTFKYFKNCNINLFRQHFECNRTYSIITNEYNLYYYILYTKKRSYFLTFPSVSFAQNAKVCWHILFYMNIFEYTSWVCIPAFWILNTFQDLKQKRTSVTKRTVPPWFYYKYCVGCVVLYVGCIQVSGCFESEFIRDLG